MSSLVNYGRGARTGKKVLSGLVLLGSAYMGVKLIMAGVSLAVGTLLPLGIIGVAGYAGWRYLVKKQ